MMCPRCHRSLLKADLAQNALSRLDNDTYVCSPCGTDEAILDFAGVGQKETWPILRNLMDWDMIGNASEAANG
jgi:hypothetical protein